MDSPTEPGLERILTAAIDLIGRQGMRGTSLRTIADQAGVSPGLIIHHYASKQGLQTACDDRVLEFIVRTKHEAMRSGFVMPLARFEDQLEQSRPTLRYLARRLSEGGPRIDEFIDGLVEDAIAYTGEAEEKGIVRPSADSRARVVVLTLWSLGALTLHEHMHRLIGVDLLGDDGFAGRYATAALEVFSHGLLTESAVTDLVTGPPPTDEKDTA